MPVAAALMLCIRALCRLRKNSCFVSGHGFSRAVQSYGYEGFSPCAFIFIASVAWGAHCSELSWGSISHAGAWQGLKPNSLSSFTARLKSCPDTKPNTASNSRWFAFDCDLPAGSQLEEAGRIQKKSGERRTPMGPTASQEKRNVPRTPGGERLRPFPYKASKLPRYHKP